MFARTRERVSPELVGVSLVSTIQPIEGLRHSDMASEHGRTMLRVVKNDLRAKAVRVGPSGGSGSCTTKMGMGSGACGNTDWPRGCSAH